MAKLTKKQQRIIDFELEQLFSGKSFLIPKSLSDVRTNVSSTSDFLTREVRLSDNRTLLLTSVGLTHMRRIVATIDKANVFDGLAGYSDIWATCRGIFEDCLSKGMRPDNAAELEALVRDRLSREINNHT